MSEIDLYSETIGDDGDESQDLASKMLSEIYSAKGSIRKQVTMLLTAISAPVKFPGLDNCPPLDELIWSTRWAVMMDLGHSTKAIARADKVSEEIVRTWAEERADWMDEKYGSVDKGMTEIKLKLIGDIATAQSSVERGKDFGVVAGVAMSAYRQLREMKGYNAKTKEEPKEEIEVEDNTPQESGITEEQLRVTDQRLEAWRRLQLERAQSMKTQNSLPAPQTPDTSSTTT